MDIVILIILLAVVVFILFNWKPHHRSPFEHRSTFYPQESKTTTCPHCQTSVRRQEHGQTCHVCGKSF